MTSRAPRCPDPGLFRTRTSFSGSGSGLALSAHTFTRMRTHAHVRTQTQAHVCIHTCTHPHTDTRACAHMLPPPGGDLPSPSYSWAGSSTPGGASCSPCLTPATPTLPPKPRKSSRSTGPPKDSGPTPLLQGCCNSRVVPRGQTPMVRAGAEGTVEGGGGLVGRGSWSPYGRSCAQSQGLIVYTLEWPCQLRHNRYPYPIPIKRCMSA